MKIKSLVNTCVACPTQYEGEYEDGCPFYFRYRHGKWRIDNNKDLIDPEYELFDSGSNAGADDGGYMHEDEVRKMIEGAR